MKHFKKYIHKYWKPGMLAVVCVTLEAVCDLFLPKLMSQLVDNGILKGDLQFVINTGLMMLGVVALGALFALTRNFLSAYVSQNFGLELRDDLFIKIQSLSVDEMDRFEGGSLITRMTNDVRQIQNFVTMMMRVFVKGPVICVGALVMMSTLNIRALVLIIPVILCVFFIISISMRLSYPRFLRMQQAVDKLNTAVREYLTGIRLVKAFRRFDSEAERFDAVNDSLSNRSIEAGRVMAVFGPGMHLFASMGIVGVVLLGARWVFNGYIEVGSVMAFVIYMQQITQSLNMISGIFNQIVRVKASGERVAEIFEASGPETGSTETVFFDETAPALEFDRVQYFYQGSTGHPALDDVTFSVNSGATTGIIGSTGSGKTTLSSLLLRFYTPTAGSIRISGVPLSGIPEAELRAKIAVVPQTALLFTGTVKENILWGKPDASDEEVRQAAKLACAHDFIMNLKNGYETLLGQNGVNLSGGQKQRLSIARALIRKPDILILDDCTSALDAITEGKVKKNLTEHVSQMTCLLISQRLGAVMSCDSILVLDDGKAAGFGAHDELIRDCELYRDIYHSQIGAYAAERQAV